jgi:DNA replication protein DnaC
MLKLTGKLSQLLDVPMSAEDEAPSYSYCALGVVKSCCQGLGFQVEARGSKTVARLCECVKTCPTCLGQAVIVDQDRKSRPCKNPSPRKICNLLNAAEIPARYKDASLKAFSNNTGNCQAVVQKVQDWIRQFQNSGSKGLLLGGPVGVGKTFVLASIAKALVARGVRVKFIDFFQLLAEVKAGYGENRSEMTIISPLIDVDVLLIDELGKGRNTEFELTILDQLVMGRYNANKAIVASTNCLFQETSPNYAYNIALDRTSSPHGNFESDSYGTLESRVGKRIYSRLMETTIMLDMKGDDYRRRS